MQRQNSKKSYETAILKCGWLKKQGGVVRNWQRRWFVIKDDHMYYFAKEEDVKPLGSIFLPGNQVIEVPFNPDDTGKYLFEIAPGTNKTRMTTTHETYPICADSDSERKEWIQTIYRVMYSSVGGGIFGQRLSETMMHIKQHSRKVPAIVEFCVEYIKKHGLETEGIFRLSGRTSLVREARNAFQRGEEPDFEATGMDIHSATSLLKQYLGELPQSIIPLKFYEPIIKLVTRDMQVEPDEAVNRLPPLIASMPKHNYNLLKYICTFLHKVTIYQDVNKMTANNLATIFANAVIRPEDDDPALLMGTAGGRTRVTLALIENAPRLFDIEVDAQGKPGDTVLDVDSKRQSYNNVHSRKRSESEPSRIKDLLSSDIGPPSGKLPSPLTARPAARQSRPTGICLDSVSDGESPVVTPDGSTSSTCNSPFVVLPDDMFHKERLFSNSSGNSVFSECDNDYDDASLNNLLESDLSELSSEQIHEHMKKIKSEVASLKSHYKNELDNLKGKIAKQRVAHRQNINQMAKKLEAEKEATCGAVSKVIKLQGDIQQYQLKYGLLE